MLNPPPEIHLYHIKILSAQCIRFIYLVNSAGSMISGRMGHNLLGSARTRGELNLATVTEDSSVADL